MIPRISVASAARDLGLPAYRAMLAELGEGPPVIRITSPPAGPVEAPQALRLTSLLAELGEGAPAPAPAAPVAGPETVAESTSAGTDPADAAAAAEVAADPGTGEGGAA